MAPVDPPDILVPNQYIVPAVRPPLIVAVFLPVVADVISPVEYNKFKGAPLLSL